MLVYLSVFLEFRIPTAGADANLDAAVEGVCVYNFTCTPSQLPRSSLRYIFRSRMEQSSRIWDTTAWLEVDFLFKLRFMRFKSRAIFVLVLSYV